MNIYSLNKTDTEEKQLRDYLGVEDFAFLYENTSNCMVSCTCGFCDVVEKKSSYQDKILRPYKEKGKYFCPKCKTEAVMYVCDDYDDSECALQYFSKVLQDDDELLVVSISGIFLNKKYNEITVNDSEDTSLMIFYYKKEFRFEFFIGDKEDDISEKENWTEEYGLDDIFKCSWNCTPFFSENYVTDGFLKYAHIDEIYNIFAKYIDYIPVSEGGVCETEEYGDLYELLCTIYRCGSSKLYGYLYSAESKYSLGFPNCYYLKDFDKALTQLNEYGIDVNNINLEESTGLSLKELNSMKNFEEISIVREFSTMVKENNMESYLKEVGANLSTSEKKAFLHVFKDYETCSFEKFTKYVFRGVKNTDKFLKDVLDIIENILCSEKKDKSLKGLINFDKLFSYELIKKYTLIDSGVIERKMFEQWSKKPTVGNFIRLLEK